ncbi:hypothetical protein H2279_07745 [Campylobacter sp. B0100352/1]|uniref:hypothetical protein n=1 Tax=Campylobacter sp. B0100352/1 TaxID=2735783 RepID=UPI001D2317F8|nr:hypothetical protein [Campylobacter sp. B0100352/1]
MKKLLEDHEIFMTHKNNSYKFNSLFKHTSIMQYYHHYDLWSNEELFLMVFEKQRMDKFILNTLNKIDSKYFFHWNQELEKYLDET